MTMQTTRTPQFGDIYFAKLTGGDHIQGGIRPVVIAQNNIGNQHSPTVEVIPMSGNTNVLRNRGFSSMSILLRQSLTRMYLQM